ncbi:methionine--tRNA ligase subunit beta [Candidatus Daviesbacteria bacterium]|nr:methionine--tRNA ligase subunit beta [Candidatus Daviesbacteria bacterium]
MISIDEFQKLELKVGTVVEAEEVEGSEKLIKLMVDLGEDEPRQVLAGVKKWYKPKDFVGKQVVVVVNLEPKMMMGLESQGMMLAASSEDGPVFLTVPKKVPSGTKIR